MATAVLYFVVAVLCIFFAAYLATYLLAVYRKGPRRIEELRQLQGGFGVALRGDVAVDRNGMLDPRVTKGIVFDRKRGKFVRQGKVSDEYVGALLDR